MATVPVPTVVPAHALLLIADSRVQVQAPRELVEERVPVVSSPVRTMPLAAAAADGINRKRIEDRHSLVVRTMVRTPVPRLEAPPVQEDP
jgi:hypothetical protein